MSEALDVLEEALDKTLALYRRASDGKELPTEVIPLLMYMGILVESHYQDVLLIEMKSHHQALVERNALLDEVKALRRG